MSGIIDVEKRHIYPIWRTYADAMKVGELNPLGARKEYELIDTINKEFDFYTIEKWKKNKSIELAADILNFANIHNNKHAKLAIEAANFIQKNSKVAGGTLLNLSDDTLDLKQLDLNQEIIFEPNNFHVNNAIHGEIKRFKAMVRREPKFAVGWIELGRRYSILSRTDIAEKCIKTALHITKSNRFVLRSAARFYIHLEEYDKALNILIKSTIASTDPWIVSAILALTRQIGKKTNHVTKGMKILKNPKYNELEISELASALGTLELESGKIKHARKLFDSALLNPTDNSIAQVCWHSETKIIDHSVGFFKNAHEAETVRKYREKDFLSSYEQNLKWIQDEPFSTRPILTASYNASIFLDKHKESAELTRLGLKINPNDGTLKNNLVYDLILDNKMEEAKQMFEAISNSNNDDDPKITIIATKGLYHFRNGEADLGRVLYTEAIYKFKKQKNEYLEALAFVNYAREEVRAKTDKASEVVKEMNDKYSNMKQLDIQRLNEKVNEMFNEQQKS